MPIFVPCPVCGAKEGRLLDVKTSRGKRFKNVLCSGCGLAWSNPREKEKVYLDYYRKEYAKCVYGLDDQTKIIEALAWRRRRTKEKIKPFGRIWKKSMSLLEVGCGLGSFLEVVKNDYGCKTYGIEPSPFFCRIARKSFKLNLYQGTFNEWFDDSSSGFPKNYEAIVLDQMLEHVLDPVLFLNKLKTKLKPDGFIFISVPNIARPKFKPQEYFIFEHVSYFSPFPLMLLLIRCGLKITEMHLENPGSMQVVAQRLESSQPLIHMTSEFLPKSIKEIRAGFKKLV